MYMDKKSRILFLIIILAILISVGLSFNKYMIQRDYFMQFQVECDPAIEKCFVVECSPEDGSECPANEVERKSYYKIIMKKAYLLPDCDPNNEYCPKVSCDKDVTCEEIFCDENTVIEGETCNDPEQYQQNDVSDA